MNIASWVLDYDFLEAQYAITLHNKVDSWFSSSMRKLLEPDTMNVMVSQYAEAIKAYGPDVAGTYFCSMLSRVCSAFQYTMTHYHIVPNLALDNMVVHMYDKGGYTGVNIQLVNEGEHRCPSLEERSQWREEVLRQFFHDTMRPLIEAVAASVKLTPSYLWAIIVQSVPYDREKWLKEASDHARSEVEGEELHNRIVEDFHYLRDGLDPSTFGIKKNPFNFEYTYVQHYKEPTQVVPLRPVCCLAFRTHTDHGYCYVCPRISDQERADKRAKY